MSDLKLQLQDLQSQVDEASQVSSRLEATVEAAAVVAAAAAAAGWLEVRNRIQSISGVLQQLANILSVPA